MHDLIGTTFNNFNMVYLVIGTITATVGGTTLYVVRNIKHGNHSVFTEKMIRHFIPEDVNKN